MNPPDAPAPERSPVDSEPAAVRSGPWSPDSVRRDLEALNYICTREVATAVYLAKELGKPLLVEGPPGVGKTELACVAAQLLGLELIRLQCYEGLDESKALYEWRYGKQLLYTQILRDQLGKETAGVGSLDDAMRWLHGLSDMFYAEEFLAPRPLLKALRSRAGAVLLIDEVDKADWEFEALLLEVLSERQVSIPELGTVRATVEPTVFLTSNSARELSDALKRRCLHLHIPFPDPETERRIVQRRVPGFDERARAQLVEFVQRLRELDLKKPPAISETIDWARALLLLAVGPERSGLSLELVRSTLNALLKFQQDIDAVAPQLPELLKPAAAASTTRA